MVTNVTPYSYYDVITPSATSSGVSSTTGTGTTTNAETTYTPDVTDTSTSLSQGPQLSTDVIAALQQYVVDSASNDVSSLISGGTSGALGSLLGETQKNTVDPTSLAQLYNSLVQGAYEGAVQKYAATVAAQAPTSKIVTDYQSKLSTTNLDDLNKQVKAALDANSFGPDGVTPLDITA